MLINTNMKVTLKKQILELKNQGLSTGQIMTQLNCSRNIILINKEFNIT